MEESTLRWPTDKEREEMDVGGVGVKKKIIFRSDSVWTDLLNFEHTAHAAHAGDFNY